MKKITYLKSLLIAAMLFVGASSAWGATSYLTTMTGQVGTNDNAENFYYATKKVKIAAGETYVYTLINYNNENNSEEWKNWVVEGNLGSKYFDCEARGHLWQANGGPTPVYTPVINTSDVSNWQTAYNGATVTISISRNVTGDQFTITHTSNVLGTTEGNTSKYYGGTFTVSVGAEEEWDIYLTEEYSHFLVKKVVYTDASGNSTYSYNASESAYVDSSNGTMNYNGSSVSQLQINNTQYRNWGSAADGSVKFNFGGKAALYKFDLSEIKSLSNITTISFTVVGISSDTKATSPVWLLGYNPEWSASTITYNTGFTNNGNAETLTGTISGKGSFQPLDDTDTYTVAASGSGYTTMTANAKTYVESAITANKDYVSFGLAVNLGRVAYLNVGADLTISCSASVVYTATFTETNSLSPTVTIYSDAGRSETVSNGTLTDGTTYYYTAVLAGYNDYLGSFTVSGADPIVNYTMTAKTRYTFTINAVDAGSNVIKAIYTDADSYEGKVHTILYPKYLTGTGNIVTHTKATDTYGESRTALAENETYTVNYTAYDGIAYFIEIEDVLSGTGYDSWNCSNGRAVRGFTVAQNIFTIPLTGTYDITYAICNNNVNNELSCTLSKNSDEIETTDGLRYVSINYIRTTGIITTNNVALESGDVIKLTPSSTNGILDYMLVELQPVTGSISASGWSTLATPCGLNFADATGISNAFVVSDISNTTVTLTSVDEMPANSGVVLKGTASTAYSIPTKGDAAFTGTNKLHAAVTAYDCAANEVYIMQGGQFHLVTAASTVPAGKAYLLASDVPSAAKELNFFFDEGTTAIEGVESRAALNGQFYNLAGQRVNVPTRGIYIVNGKKVYVK